MAENESRWKRTEYETWEDAFHGLAPVIRQQSVRVAAYTQVLYVQACAVKFCTYTRIGAERMLGQYADLAYKCGLYHQLGKALVPPEYQIWVKDFTEEEEAVYRKYTTDGRALVANLQARSERAWLRRKGNGSEQPTKNIPWLMIRESCEQHMERWDGSGYPLQLEGDEISPIAQIVGLAKELDRLASETKSEDPFAEAFQTLIDQEGELWNPELIDILKSCRAKCRAIYTKHIHYTMTLPKTIHLVEKKKGRPMGLKYRPMVSDKEGTVEAYEAVPWFGGILDRPGETEAASELEAMLIRKQMVEDISTYFLYEAADTVHRIENCKLQIRAVMLQMLPSFYQLNTQLEQFKQLFKDQPIPKEKLLLTVPADTMFHSNKKNLEQIERYLRNGIQLVLDGYDPGQHGEKLSPEQLKSMGFTYLRLSPSLYGKLETANLIYKLREDGFTILGGGVDSQEILEWLEGCQVAFMSGTITGVEVEEDELIRDGLNRER